MKPLLLVVGLGLAGIDPLGLTLLIAAVAAGARKPQVISFCIATMVAAISIGVVFSVFGKQLMDQIVAFVPDADDPAWAIVELIVAALIVYWLVSSVRASNKSEVDLDAKLPDQLSVFTMLLTGLVFGAVTVLDPTFFATSVIAGQTTTLLPMIGLVFAWLLLSQILLFAFALAYLFDVHQPLIDFAKPIWNKLKRPIVSLLYVGLALFAALLTADALTLFVSGNYLIPL